MLTVTSYSPTWAITTPESFCFILGQDIDPIAGLRMNGKSVCPKFVVWQSRILYRLFDCR